MYNVGSTAVDLSEDEATSMALVQAQSYSWTSESGNNTFEVKDFKATQAMVWETFFVSSLYGDKSRSSDPLTLFPVRHVWVSRDV